MCGHPADHQSAWPDPISAVSLQWRGAGTKDRMVVWEFARTVPTQRLEYIASAAESTTAQNASKSLNTVQRSKAVEMVGFLRCRRPGDVQRFFDR